MTSRIYSAEGGDKTDLDEFRRRLRGTSAPAWLLARSQSPGPQPDSGPGEQEGDVVVLFADLNGRDSDGLYGALEEDASAPVTPGQQIQVDDGSETFTAIVSHIERGIIYFHLGRRSDRTSTPD